MRARVARLSLSLARRSIDRINDREAKAVSVSLAPGPEFMPHEIMPLPAPEEDELLANLFLAIFRAR